MDGVVDATDRDTFVEEILGTVYGDANVDVGDLNIGLYHDINIDSAMLILTDLHADVDDDIIIVDLG